MAIKYRSALNGPEMDAALVDVNQHNAEAWAVGTRNGTPVTSGDETYQNNAKYYANWANSVNARFIPIGTSGGVITSTINSGRTVIAYDDSSHMRRVYLYAGRDDSYHYFESPDAVINGSGHAYIDVLKVGVSGSSWIRSSVQLPTWEEFTYGLTGKADKYNAVLTGIPTAPRAASHDNSTQIANTAFVQGELNEVATELSIAINGKADKSDLARTEEEALSAFVTEEATPADIVTFTDGASNVPVKSFVGSIIPVQDLNGQSAPYPAGGGANKWDEQWEVGGISQETGQNSSASNTIRAKNICACSPSTTYYLGTNVAAIYWYGTGGSYISFDYNNASGNVRTSPSTATGFRILMKSGYGTTYHNDIAVNYPSTVTTYSPYANICPISGWTGANITRAGVNLWDETAEVGTYSQTTGAKEASTTALRSVGFIRVNPSTSYYAYVPTGIFLRRFYYKADKTFITSEVAQSGTVFATPANCAWMTFVLSTSYGTTYNHDISINYPSTVTTYQPYNGSTILLDFGQTVYAGTLTALGGGLWKIQPTHKIDSLDSHTWNYGGNNRFNATGFSDMKQDGLRSEYIYCSCYAPNVGSGAYDPFTIYNGTGGYLYVVDDRTTDGATLKTLLAGQKMVYPLATLPAPITITGEDLQTLLGANTVWADCGSVTGMTYRADTKLYIQKLLNGGTRTLAAAPLNRTSILMEPEATPEEEE